MCTLYLHTPSFHSEDMLAVYGELQLVNYRPIHVRHATHRSLLTSTCIGQCCSFRFSYIEHIVTSACLYLSGLSMYILHFVDRSYRLSLVPNVFSFPSFYFRFICQIMMNVLGFYTRVDQCHQDGSCISDHLLLGCFSSHMLHNAWVMMLQVMDSTTKWQR